jgi:hypothetical protein
MYKVTPVFLFMLLASCGGGSNMDAKTPSLKLSKNALYFQDYVLGVSAENVNISFTVENQKESIFVVATNHNPELIDKVYVSTGILTIYPAHPYKYNLAPGTYQGSITIALCKDSTCKSPIAGSEQVINIVYDVFKSPS